MAIKLGLDAKLYYDITGVVTPTWLELDNVTDVTLNIESGEADVTTRANSGWRANVATVKDASLEFEMIWDTADLGFIAIRNAFINGTVIGLAVMDGPILTVGSEGLLADFMITGFTRNEALEDAIKVSVTAKPTYSATPPEWTEISA